MFERLTKEVRAAVVGAHETARENGDEEVTPTHLLLVLSRGDGSVPALLRRHGIDEQRISAVRTVGNSPASTAARPFDDEDAEALRSFGIDLGAIRRAVEASFGEGALDDPTRVADAGTEHAADDAHSPEALRDAEDVITDEPVGRRGRLRIALGGKPRFATTSKKSIELALREAIRDRSKEVGEEHLVRGILRADDDGIRALLRTLRVDVRALRQDLEGRGRATA